MYPILLQRRFMSNKFDLGLIRRTRSIQESMVELSTVDRVDRLNSIEEISQVDRDRCS